MLLKGRNTTRYLLGYCQEVEVVLYMDSSSQGTQNFIAVKCQRAISLNSLCGFINFSSKFYLQARISQGVCQGLKELWTLWQEKAQPAPTGMAGHPQTAEQLGGKPLTWTTSRFYYRMPFPSRFCFYIHLAFGLSEKRPIHDLMNS